MATTIRQQLAEQAEQIRQLREQLDDLRAEAFVIRTLSEVLGHPSVPAPAPRARRHLTLVQDCRDEYRHSS